MLGGQSQAGSFLVGPLNWLGALVANSFSATADSLEAKYLATGATARQSNCKDEERLSIAVDACSQSVTSSSRYYSWSRTCPFTCQLQAQGVTFIFVSNTPAWKSRKKERIF